MKQHILIFCLLAVFARGAASQQTEVAGAYRYDGTTQLIALALLPNGNYLAHWSLDIFPDNGSASGTWRVDGDEVRLTPKKEEGELKGYLRVLLVKTIDGRRALLRKEDVKHEGNPFFYFYPKGEPNSERSAAP